MPREEDGSYLRALVDLGHLPRKRLDVAARLGHPGARDALDDPPPLLEPPRRLGWLTAPLRLLWRQRLRLARPARRELVRWVEGFGPLGFDACRVAAEAAVEMCQGSYSEFDFLVEQVVQTHPDEFTPERAADLALQVALTRPSAKVRQTIEAGLLTWALGRSESSSPVSSPDLAEDSPIAKLANRILEDAYVRGASQVRIDVIAEGGAARIQYVTDGEAEERMRIPISALSSLLRRYVYLAGGDVFGRSERGGGFEYSGRHAHLRLRVWLAAGQDRCTLSLTRPDADG